MKQKIMKWIRQSVRLGALLMIGLFGTNASAQAPWCDGNPTGTNMCGWNTGATINPANYRGVIEQVVINQGTNVVFSKGADGCNPGTNGFSLQNTPANAFDLTPGGDYSITVTIQSNNIGYQHRCGIWIDFNKDNSFSSAECINPTTVNNMGIGNTTRTYDFSIPCTGVSAGASRLRIKGSINPMTAASGCIATNPGEVEDYSINFALPTSLAANFVVPSIIYTDYDVDFINTSQSGIFANSWDKDADGTYDATTSNYVTRWSVGSTSTECLKLRAENCLGLDSITKCFSVVVPTVVPSVDFISSATIVNLFGAVKLNDLTDFGPTSWNWEVFDSSDVFNIKDQFSGAYFMQNGTSLTSKNPEIRFIESGKYTVCLTAGNGIGSSKRICKVAYVEVLPLRDFTLGSGGSVTTEPVGRIYDHAGPDVNYGPAARQPNTDKLLINPCGATQIDFEFSQIKFGTGPDSLFIYAGENAGAPRVAAIGRGTPVPFKTTVMGGAAFVTFESDSRNHDSGFIGTFNAKLGPQTPPLVDFDLPSDGYFGVEVDLDDNSTNKLGIPTYQWDIEEPVGTPAATYGGASAKHTFVTTGNARVCLTVSGCAGSDTKCKIININTPTTPTELDYVSDNRRPGISDQIQMTTTADKANKWLWSVFPVTASFSDATEKNPTVNFSAPGPYTFTLRAWNSIDSAATVKTLVKDKYVVVVDYCKPVVNILSSDVAISSFILRKDATDLINNPSSVGVKGYNDFSATSSMEGTFGATYNFTIERPSTVDTANTKVWVDFNLDGAFAPSEMVKEFPASNAKVLTGTFTVPDISQSFIGNGIIRVSMAYGNTSNTACGPLAAGEVEDYGMSLDNDNLSPIIALIGSADTIVERASIPNYVDPGATASDPTEGDITSSISSTTDMDQTTAGIYTVTYCVTDASGNGPICVTRTIKVVLDRTAPVLTLNGNDPIDYCYEVDPSAMFMDPGATASDLVDGNLTPSITVTGTVDSKTTGTYVLTYSVSDVQGNATSLTRTVNVVDCDPPTINPIGSEQIQINTIWADQTTITDQYDGQLGRPFSILTPTPGPNGMPNTTVRAAYPVTYTGSDRYGNAAVPVLRNYVVDDFIAPVIDLKTLDTVFHRVNTEYFSTPAQRSDNFYNNNNVSLSHIDKGNVDAYTLGTYTETFVAVDGSGNRDTAIRYVKVIDDVSPVVFAPAINGCAGYAIDNMADIQLSDNYDAPSSLLPNVVFIQNNVNVHLPGVYTMTYQVTDLSGNVSVPFTRPVYITYCLPGKTSVQTVNLDELTTVYPNPSAGNINVKVAGASNQVVEVKIYNALGAEVATASNSQGEEIQVDLANHAAGIYTVKVTTGGQSITKKVILTK